ncbi:MAG TPA: DUF615 domain-containing protein [Gammaproteobacteria bacterium]|nr:DUF615 domain-containing protein [Gammaproteobacteria bacterium]
MDNTQPEHDEPEIKSRTQKKREAEALQAIGERLVGLSDKQLKQLNLPETLFDSIKQAQSIHAHGGKKRQLQYIGKLMRDENLDMDSITHLLAQIDTQASAENQAFKAIEQWRDRLVEEGNQAVSLLLEQYPQADVQQIRQLVRNANNKKNEKLAKKSKKAIFQLIKQLMTDNQE